MGKAVLARSLADGATITAGSAVSSLPVSNLLTPQPFEIWRATDLSNAYAVVDLGAAMAINLVWLGYTNLSADATWRVRAADDEASLTDGSADYDSTAVTFWPQSGLDNWDFTHGFLWLDASAQTRRWWRVDLIDTGNAAGYVQAGRLYLANAWQLPKNVQYDHGPQWVPALPGSTRAVSGARYAQSGPLYRRYPFDLDALTAAQIYDNLFDLQRRKGIAGDVLFIFNPDATSSVMETMIYGAFEDLEQARNRAFNRYRMTVALEEMR